MGGCCAQGPITHSCSFSCHGRMPFACQQPLLLLLELSLLSLELSSRSSMPFKSNSLALRRAEACSILRNCNKAGSCLGWLQFLRAAAFPSACSTMAGSVAPFPASFCDVCRQSRPATSTALVNARPMGVQEVWAALASNASKWPNRYEILMKQYAFSMVRQTRIS